ncbi:tyrosine--tRNA ligase [Candidatus Gottesmanbacteria bacterium]|nr:tyrosine--tRNA ligase [Candidatus Gottesmanbacteria bacterium]
MKISVDKRIFEKVPDYKLGVAVIAGINNQGSISPDIKVEPFAKTELSAWINAAKSQGIDPEKFPPANVNISQRFTQLKKLPSVNPAVDLCNIVSLQTGTPVGLHDLDTDPGNIEVRLGETGDTYVPLNQVKAENVVDPIVFASGNHVQTRNWTWRIAETSKVDEKSKNVVLFINTLSIDYDESLEILNETVSKFLETFGGKLVQKGILTKENPEIVANLKTSAKRPTQDKIDEVLTRGVENIIPNKQELEKVLRSGKKLNIYLGIDPTFTKIHLGHAVPIRKLRQFVELGHSVTLLIGDFTALIGDTSDKTSERPILTKEEIQKNFQTYKKQAEKILDFSKVKLRHNSEWLGKLTFEDIVKLCQHFSLGDFVSRELIRKRMESAVRVRLDEVLYPIMQGYDSYFMDTDIQVGGTDQTFNMQAGRTLQQDLRAKQSFVLANGFLEGTDGRKMSKSWNNAIWLDDEPKEMFGKVMSLKDDLIIQYFTLGTNVTLAKVEEIKKNLESGENPMILKKELAREIVTELHGKEAAQKAQKEFESVVQKGETPKNLTEIKISTINTNLVELLVQNNLITSRSAAKRIVEQGGVELDQKPITDPKLVFKITSGMILKVGKRNFFKLII